MTKNEFIKVCCFMGYCTKRIAEEYTKKMVSEGKTEFSEKDFEDVYRFDTKRRVESWEMPPHANHVRLGGAKTTKSYKFGGSDED